MNLVDLLGITIDNDNFNSVFNIGDSNTGNTEVIFETNQQMSAIEITEDKFRKKF